MIITLEQLKTSLQAIKNYIHKILPTVASGIEIIVEGTEPTIDAVANNRYICGEVTTLTVNPPEEGIIEVVFSSGTTPSVLILPTSVKMPEWFEIQSGYTYAVSIENTRYGTVMSWQT